MERSETEYPPLASPKCEYKIFDCYFYRNDCEFNPRQRRGDRQNIEYYIERIHEQVFHEFILRPTLFLLYIFFFFSKYIRKRYVIFL